MKEKNKLFCGIITARKYKLFILIVGLIFVINLVHGALLPIPSLDRISLYEDGKKITDSSVIVKITHVSDIAQRVIIRNKDVCCNGECHIEQIYHGSQELFFYKTNDPNLICNLEEWKELYENQEYREVLNLYGEYLDEAASNSVYHTQIELEQPRDQKIRGEVSVPEGYMGGGGGTIGKDRYFNIDIEMGTVQEEGVFMYYLSTYWVFILIVLIILIFIGFFLYKIKHKKES